MPSRFRTPLHVRRAPHGSPSPRRLVTLIHGALLLVIVLCAVMHGGTAEETHGPVPVSVTAAEATPGGAKSHTPHARHAPHAPHARHAPHAPHAPHSAHECAPGAVVRTTAQVAEQPVPGGEAPAAVMASAAVLGSRPAFRATRRRRRPGPGRAALVVTSRWRI